MHFHLPLHADPEPPLSSTSGVLNSTLEALFGGPRALTDHVEVETYTWQVLPEDRRPQGDAGLVAGLAAELAWTRDRLVALGPGGRVPMTRWLARLVIAVLCLGTTTVLLEGPAFAHGQLVESTPEKGGTLADPVQTLTMWFTEAPPRNAHFAVTGPDGKRVEQQWLVGATKRLDEPVTELFLVDGKWEPRLYHEGYSVEVPIAYWPKVGEYSVDYLSIASDGEQVKGQLKFTYAGKPTKAPDGWKAPDHGPDPGLLAALEAAHEQDRQRAGGPADDRHHHVDPGPADDRAQRGPSRWRRPPPGTTARWCG